MSDKQRAAIEDIYLKCSTARNGQCVDIPLSIFYTAYGSDEPSNLKNLTDRVSALKAEYGFESHELDRNVGLLRLIKPASRKGVERC